MSREDDLRRAIRLSEEEDARRKKALEDANAKALFDDNQQVYVVYDGVTYLRFTAC